MISRKLISLIYAGLFVVLIALILLANYIYVIEDTDAKMRRVFWKQSEVIAEAIALGAQQAIQTTHLDPAYLEYYAQNIARNIDSLQGLLSTGGNNRLEEIRKNNHLEYIQVFNSNGKILYQAPEQIPKDVEGPAFALKRHQGGTLMISLGREKTVNLKLKRALQDLADNSKDRQFIRYISFYNDKLINIADTDSARIGQEASLSYVKESLVNQTAFFLKKDLDFATEVVQPYAIEGNRVGVFHLEINSDDLKRVSEDTKQNTFFVSVVAITLLLLIVSLILKYLFIYLDKMDRVEKERQENEKMVSLGNLAAGVAHEIRNPLNSISITIQRLQLEFEPPEEKQAKEYQSFLELMKKEVKRLNQIVTDFLGFSKPFAPQSDVFLIQDFWDNCLTFFLEEAKERGIVFEADMEHENDAYYGDEEKLKQVVLNLLGNAMDATGRNKKIKLRSRLDKQEAWHIEIEDEGIGIPKETLTRLFDIYYTTKQSGTGLGLYITRKIIQAHDGHIELNNNAKVGVTCSIFLPKREIEANQKEK